MAKLNFPQDTKVTLTFEKLNVTCLINKLKGKNMRKRQKKGFGKFNAHLK